MPAAKAGRWSAGLFLLNPQKRRGGRRQCVGVYINCAHVKALHQQLTSSQLPRRAGKDSLSTRQQSDRRATVIWDRT